jgi:transcriptional regulator with XRE-family HTH domain
VQHLESDNGTVAPLDAVLGVLEYRFAGQHEGVSFGAWLALKRRSLGLTQQELASKAGLSRPSVTQVERMQGHLRSLTAALEALGEPISLVPQEGDASCVRLHVGDCRELLPSLPRARFNTCITSPPYFGQRDYAAAGQIGLEPTPEEYIASIIEVMREVRRVLRQDGTLWLVIGDAFTRCNATDCGQASR